jgi:hypothetical protein
VLWFEFEEPVQNSDDAYFARVTAYGPDPLLAAALAQNPVPNPVEPPLPIDPELIRVITPGQPEDRAGLDAMTMLIESNSSKRHFMVPLPAGTTEESLELFGFWTYELRVGHKLWATEQGRFYQPLRVTGVQHPAPHLICTAYRQKAQIIVTAPYATAVLGGENMVNVRSGDPQTSIWVLIYAQVMQADGAAHRNVLLKHSVARTPRQLQERRRLAQPTRDVMGTATFTMKEIEATLKGLALPPDSPLSVLAVELLPGGTDRLEDPLGAQLGGQRILRASPLTPVPAAC